MVLELVEVVVREFIVFVSTGGIGTIGRSGSQGIHSICITGGIGTIGRSGSRIQWNYIVFVNWWNWYYW